MTFFQQPLLLGGLEVPNRVWLAPLAGVSDVPFRRICQELGAGLSYVEMLSAVAIQHRNKRTLDMCRRHPAEPLLGVQVTGPTAASVGDALRYLATQPFDVVDLNMGCSVRKVVHAGSGSGILDEPDRISDTVASARAATEKPLTVKTRLGMTRRSITIEDTARRVVQAGADGFMIHGRTRDEKYGVPADVRGIARGIAAVRAAAARPFVTVGNGDLFDFAAARTMQAETGCDAVLISRGALGNPWIFSEILEERTRHPGMEEWGDVVLRHLDYQEAHYGDTSLAAIMMRKHLLWYIKGFPCNKELGARAGYIERIDEGRQLIRSYLAEWPRDLPRFEGAHRTESRFGPNSKYDPKWDMHRQHDRGVGDVGA
jgi:tRNA-dihydrouridine synthase B